MGAMLVGMATGFFALTVSFIWKAVLLTAVFIDSKYRKMSSFRWTVCALLIDLLCVPFYIYAKSRISKDGSFNERSFSGKLIISSVICYAVSVLLSVLWTFVYGCF